MNNVLTKVILSLFLLSVFSGCVKQDRYLFSIIDIEQELARENYSLDEMMSSSGRRMSPHVRLVINDKNGKQTIIATVSPQGDITTKPKDIKLETILARGLKEINPRANQWHWLFQHNRTNGV
jgi:hypothetical protein